MADTGNINESIKIAYYYYKMDMTQDEIAKKMFISRQRVNRILKKCLETGIVKVVIQEYEQQNVEIEAKLEALLGLNEAIVITCEEEDINGSLGAAASAYLDRVVKDNDIIGFSRGRALSAMVGHLRPVDKKNLTVTQLVGGQNAEEVHINSDDIVRRSSEILNAKSSLMYAPIILDNKALRDSMMNESFFTKAYETMKACTTAFVGIGDMSNESSVMQRKFISVAEYSVLQSFGAVGEICTHYFDIEGKIIKSDVNDRVLAIDYESFEKIPLRIGIGGGPEKISAIRGAIRGKVINVLITDLKTAQALV